jgi:hypothetical protein
LPASAAALAASCLLAAAPFGTPEMYGKKTDEVLILCSNGGMPCADFINGVLKTLNASTAVRPAGAYRGCAPAPLSGEQVDQVVLWILSRAQLATGYAVQDIGLAAEDLWPCK